MSKRSVQLALEQNESCVVAYRPELARVLGGINAALFASQMLYWTNRTKDPDGWIWKSQSDWEAETGLSRYQQERARAKLRALGVLEERYGGIPRRLYYRLNTEKLAALLAAFSHASAQETSTLACQFPARKRAENQHAISETTMDYAETTPETISENLSGDEKHPPPRGSVLDEWFGKREERHSTETPPPRGDEPWLHWGGGRIRPRDGISALTLARVGWLIENLTGLAPTSDADWRTWPKFYQEIYTASRGNWQAMRAGIQEAWAREARYKPSHPRGFVDVVRKHAVIDMSDQHGKGAGKVIEVGW